MSKQDCKVFIGGLSWETTGEKLKNYFENFGTVREAFVSYNRNNGRPRGFGFVVFDCPEVADKVVAAKHTIDRREVEAKKAVPKDEYYVEKQGNGPENPRSRKVFIGGLAPAVDEKVLQEFMEQFGQVEDAVVMYDHENKRPRGFGFVTFTHEDSVDNIFQKNGAVHMLLEKQIEIKSAIPRDQIHGASSKSSFASQPTGTNQLQIQPNVNATGTIKAGLPQTIQPGTPTSTLSQFSQNSQMPTAVPLYSRGLQAHSGNVSSLASSYNVYASSYGLQNTSEMFTNSHTLYNLAAALPKPLHGTQASGPIQNNGIEKQVQVQAFKNDLNSIDPFGRLSRPIANAYPHYPAESMAENLYPKADENTFIPASDLSAASVGWNISSKFNCIPEGLFARVPAPGWSS